MTNAKRLFNAPRFPCSYHETTALTVRTDRDADDKPIAIWLIVWRLSQGDEDGHTVPVRLSVEQVRQVHALMGDFLAVIDCPPIEW
jgi:hypothetical protein